MKQIIIILTGLFLSISVFTQNRVVHGKIIVFSTYPVQNVEVTAKKAKTSVMTDSLGQFSLVCFEKDIIKIKAKSFQSVNKKLGPDTDTDTLIINLIFVDTKSNRVRVISDGYINEEDLNYAIKNLEQVNNDFCNYTDISDLIMSKFSGVTVSGGNVYIRGSGSFSGQIQALIIVNGVPAGAIDWIMPCQIKTIRVLKDNEAAIYGTRGGNGVVVIETRNDL